MTSLRTLLSWCWAAGGVPAGLAAVWALALWTILLPGCRERAAPPAPVARGEWAAADQPVAGGPGTALAGAPQRIVVDGVEVQAPAGSTVEFTREGERSARGDGASLTASGEKNVTEFDASAPTGELGADGSARASGGESSIDAAITGATGLGLRWVFGIAGGVSLAGAGVALAKGLKTAAMICGAAGVVLVGLSLWPSVVIAVALVLLCVGGLLWADHKGLLHREALRGVVAGVEALPDASDRRLVKASIANHADDRDRLTIQRMKRADGFGSER